MTKIPKIKSGRFWNLELSFLQLGVLFVHFMCTWAMPSLFFFFLMKSSITYTKKVYLVLGVEKFESSHIKSQVVLCLVIRHL